MPESNVKRIISQFIEEFDLDLMEERVMEYLIRELRMGRRLSTIMQDTYIKNRSTEERIKHILENPEILETVESELKEAFQKKDFKFSD